LERAASRPILVITNALLVWVAMMGAGALGVVAWSLADGVTASGSRWKPMTGWLLAALLPVVVVAGLALLTQMPEEAMAAGLLPLSHSLPGKLLLLLLPLVLATSAVLGIGGARLSPAAWRTAAALGALQVIAAAWFLERLREGGGPSATGWRWGLLVVCRALAVLAVAETVAPGRPFWVFWAGLAVVPSFLLLPDPLREALAPIAGSTALAAVVALLAARWLPRAWRRTAVLLGSILLAVLWVEAARVASSFAALPSAR
jgi:hypothetical protein